MNDACVLQAKKFNDIDFPAELLLVDLELWQIQVDPRGSPVTRTHVKSDY
jgi:hypothetical protein